jgi:protocatechuate 3,4-dioxygenase beta subunit
MKMNRYNVMMVLLFAAVFALAGCSSSGNSSEGGRITGHVTDTAGNAASVNVYLYAGSGDYMASRSTDSNGNYAFQGLASGEYKVKFTKGGYAAVWYNVATDQAKATPVTVTSPNTTGGIHAVMGIGGKITGRVTDRAGNPTSAVAYLYTRFDQPVASLSTNLNGNYTFQGLASGTYKISFSKSGCPRAWYDGATDQAKATPVTVTSPNTTSVMDSVMDTGGKITGRITDAAGNPVSATVYLYGSSEDFDSQSTDSNGNYTFPMLASGTYKVWFFSRNGYGDVWYSGAANRETATPVTVTAPNTSSGIDAVMGIGGRITGRITDAAGNPVSDAYAYLYTSSSSTPVNRFRTDSSGNYALRGLASGTYKVLISKGGYAAVWYNGAADRATATLVSVTSPDTTGNIDVVLGIGGKITGRVTGTTGDPAMVVLYTKGSSGSYTVQTDYLSADTNGSYAFQGLKSGTYKMKFAKDGYADVWYNGKTDEASATEITVTAPGTTGGIDAVMGVGGKITGRVTDANGTPISGIGVELIAGADDGVMFIYSDANGNYTFQGLASGRYKVRFARYGYPDVWYNGKTDQASATQITVTSPGTTGGIDAVMGIGGKITGRVTDANGTPITGAFVELSTGGDDRVSFLDTDSNGYYAFQGLSSGTYKVAFFADGYPAVWYNGATDQETATLIEVTSPNTIGTIDVVMK